MAKEFLNHQQRSVHQISLLLAVSQYLQLLRTSKQFHKSSLICLSILRECNSPEEKETDTQVWCCCKYRNVPDQVSEDKDLLRFVLFRPTESDEGGVIWHQQHCIVSSIKSLIVSWWLWIRWRWFSLVVAQWKKRDYWSDWGTVQNHENLWSKKWWQGEVLWVILMELNKEYAVEVAKVLCDWQDLAIVKVTGYKKTNFLIYKSLLLASQPYRFLVQKKISGNLQRFTGSPHFWNWVDSSFLPFPSLQHTSDTRVNSTA